MMNPTNGYKYAAHRALRNNNTRRNNTLRNYRMTQGQTPRKQPGPSPLGKSIKNAQRRYPNIYANNARLSNRTRKVVKNVRNSIIAGEKLDPKFNSYMRRVIQEELLNEPVNLSALNYL